MPEWVATNAWSIATVVVGLIAIGIAIAIALVQRRTKRLVYELLSRTQLVGSIGDIPQLDVLFRGERVTDVGVVELRFLNTGNLPIAAADYERPIRAAFGRTATVLTAEVVEVHPTSIQIACQPDGNGFVLEPILLNGGDWVRVKTLVSEAGTVTVDSRIAGVSEIQMRGASPRSVLLGLLLFGIGLLLTAAGLLVAVGINISLAVAVAAALGGVSGVLTPLVKSLLGDSRRDSPQEVGRLNTDAKQIVRAPEGSQPRRESGQSEARPAPSAGHAGHVGAVGPQQLPQERSTPAPNPWMPRSEELDAALELAVEAAKQIGPDAVLEFSWIDVFPDHEVNFHGSSDLADRFFLLTVPQGKEPYVFGVRRMANSWGPLQPGNEAPWRQCPGWEDVVRLSWLRVPKPFAGTAQLSVDKGDGQQQWKAKYETRGALWESTCYKLADGKPLEVHCS